jgi:CHAD domain-containing protein
MIVPPVPPPDDADGSCCFAAIARTCAAEVLAEAARAAQHDEPESLHKLRVAIRRARAALSLFRAATTGGTRLPLARELRTLQRRLGETREWDVLVDETLASLPAKLTARRATRGVVRLARKQRDVGHKHVRAALREPASVATLRRLAAWPDRHFGARASPRPPSGRWDTATLAQPATSLAAAVLDKRHRQARKQGRGLRHLDQAALHRLRIRIKKLRYAAEFFAGLWPDGRASRRARRYLASLRELQQALGSWHDIAVAPALIARLGPDAGDTAALAAWLATAEQARREDVAASWRRFTRRDHFWDAC